jgi:hypothetical protein
MKNSTLVKVFIAFVIICMPVSVFSQDIYPVTVGKDQITYRVGTSAEYTRMLPTALPGYIILIRPTFDLFPGMSDPEIESELIAVLDEFNISEASTREKTFFLQNLAHLVLLDIDNVSTWDKDYGEALESLIADNKYSARAILVRQLIDDYRQLYLPSVQKKEQQ